MSLEQELCDLNNFPCNMFLDRADGVSDCAPCTWRAGQPRSQPDHVHEHMHLPRRDDAAQVQDLRLGIVRHIPLELRRSDQQTMMCVETTVAEVCSWIPMRLKALVQTNIFARIASRVMGHDCRQVFAGFCAQGVVGLTDIGHSYTACGVLAVSILVLMYGV